MSLAPIWEAQRRLLSEHCALVRLNEVREQEARRIGQALHDEAAQLLAAVHMAVEEVARELESPQRERLRAVRGLLDRVEDQLRSVSHELRPMVLDDFGLQAALEVLGDTASRRTGIQVVVDVSIASPLPVVAETTLYRVVQEALNNCTRHARATLVTITVREHGRTISCCVKDDGAGFDVQETVNRKGGCGLGLLGIRERLASLGGELSIQSAPGRGTELVASFRADAEFLGACAARCPDNVDSRAARCA
jgi:signal transduction histidine kinase